jgi:N-acylneuraminate cytidylyltransferase
MENGAFYINNVKNIITSQNRLSGKIGIYEMPEYTAMEIDEPDDWDILESLMYRHVLQKQPKKKIKLFLTDVDGVLTDGGMYYSESGDELKKFNTRDGMAFELLRKAGIKIGIITSENTQIVENRAKKLKVDYLYQGQFEGGKLAVAKTICEKEGITLDEVAYIGDDINCYELLSHVGIAACPADAEIYIKQIPDIICLTLKGGRGCVRELISFLFA